MNKIIKKLPIILLLAVTSCNSDGYKQYDVVTIEGEDSSRYSSYVTYTYVFAYKAETASDKGFFHGENNDTVYACMHFKEPQNVKKIGLPKNGVYIYGDNPGEEISITYSGEMGTYETYSKVYYSKSKNMVKEERASLKPTKNDQTRELNKKYMHNIVKNGDQYELSAYLMPSPRSEIFSSKVVTEYTAIGDKVVTYK